MTYRISTVAEMTGIARNTLIAWERRYGFVRPGRRDNGYRSYNEEDVSRILRVKNAVSAGLKVSEAVQLLRASDERMLKSGSPLPPPLSAFVASSENFAKVRDDLVAALTSYDRESADRILELLVAVPFVTRLEEVYFPVLRIVGRMWENGEVTIAQEHYASGLIRANLAAMLISVGPRPLHAPHAACTTFPNEQHEIVALALAVQLSLAGQKVSYLGANMPADDLGNYCKKQAPDLLCVSCIRKPSQEDLDLYVGVLGENAPDTTRIVLGGQCLRDMQCPSKRIEIVPNWEDLTY